ncbi:hypothetical protein QAD02_012661 [Eretmocerus hayati]|uniref:Uncharacterized protein n=1 Tax=Eretmocerus hayati TaxID=131215 RepID=A0ACC2P0K5_9HYME|nr:hypothetical protein QAD02_012661 [Eretmocerus hayati]
MLPVPSAHFEPIALSETLVLRAGLNGSAVTLCAVHWCVRLTVRKTFSVLAARKAARVAASSSDHLLRLSEACIAEIEEASTIKSSILAVSIEVHLQPSLESTWPAEQEEKNATPRHFSSSRNDSPPSWASRPNWSIFSPRGSHSLCLLR